jgi:hypothetical protein
MQMLPITRKSPAHSITCPIINFLPIYLKEIQMLYLISRTNVLSGVASDTWYYVGTLTSLAGTHLVVMVDPMIFMEVS